MRIEKLSLKDIGPFVDANLDFSSAVEAPQPVAMITGENGTGKSIVLDAIRGLFGKEYCRLERNIARRGTEPVAGSPTIHAFFWRTTKRSRLKVWAF